MMDLVKKSVIEMYYPYYMKFLVVVGTKISMNVCLTICNATPVWAMELKFLFWNWDFFLTLTFIKVCLYLPRCYFCGERDY